MRKLLTKRHYARMWRAEDGSVTVEYALWVPALFIVFLLVADTAAAYFAQGRMWHVAGDVSRAVVTGRITQEQAEAFVTRHTSYKVEMAVLEDDVFALELSQPFSQVGTGMMLRLAGDMRVLVFQHFEEPDDDD